MHMQDEHVQAVSPAKGCAWNDSRGVPHDEVWDGKSNYDISHTSHRPKRSTRYHSDDQPPIEHQACFEASRDKQGLEELGLVGRGRGWSFEWLKGCFKTTCGVTVESAMRSLLAHPFLLGNINFAQTGILFEKGLMRRRD